MQRLELGGYACGECAGCDVSDVAKEVLDADFFRFFGFDRTGGVDEGSGGGGAVLSHIMLALLLGLDAVGMRTSLISSTAK